MSTYAPTLAEAVAHGTGIERSFLCPVHGDSRPSASLNTLKGVWYCYTCGARGGLTGEDALIEPDYMKMKLWLMEQLEDKRVYPESWLARWDAGPVHPYWLRRVGEAAARAFRLGYDAERNAVTYPLRRTDGCILGVVRRGLDEGDGPRYKYPRGIDIGQLLFNYRPEALRAVVLCEGAMDAIAFWRVGVRAFAIYGSNLSAEQIKLIDRLDPDTIYTAFDNDDAGWKATLAVRRSFRHREVAQIRWPASWGKDVDEIGDDRLREICSVVLERQGLACIESRTCGSAQTHARQKRVISLSDIAKRSKQSIVLKVS